MVSVAIWNLLGGLDWNGLPIACEMYGVADVDALVRDLVTIREFNRPRDD